jgi:hypothetical protein
MALQSSGDISFGNIRSEFGSPISKSLGAYRISETYGELTNIPLDTGIPQSGQIKFSDFYNKRLNIIVNYWSGNTEYRQNAKQRYIDNGVNVVGNFTSRPSNSSGKKVIIHVNKVIGSENNPNQAVVALRTGTWDSGTSLIMHIGSSARILGGGGNGGRGANNTSEGGVSAQNGNSALGLEYNGVIVNVYSGSYISCGFGGGGGGGASIASVGGGGGKKGGSSGSSVIASGGGGGGGAGLPAGFGGPGGSSSYSGDSGSSGSTFSRGTPGGGGSGQVCVTVGKGKFATTTCATATGASGGFGGDSGNSPGSGGSSSTGGGANGANGYSIIYSQSYNLNNYGGTVIGGSVFSGVL